METAPSREGIAYDVRISNTSKMKDFSVIYEGHSHVLELWEISWTELRFKYVICEGGMNALSTSNGKCYLHTR